LFRLDLPYAHRVY